MKTTGDDDLRERFDALRTADHARAPEFRALWNRARERASRTKASRAPRLISIAAAAGIVLAIGLGYRARRDSAAPQDTADSTRQTQISTPTLETWRSPTAGFLRTPGDELLRATPPIESSILDGAVPPSTHRKGG